MTANPTGTSDHVPTNPDRSAFAHWPDGMYEEMMAGHESGCVGSTLVSETDRVRVWHLAIGPGQRCGFHRHVNPYFWTALRAGRGKNYVCSGEVSEVDYIAGQTRHFHYGDGEQMVHAIENTGDDVLEFTTVEFLDGPNDPLPVPDSVRLVEEPA